MMISKDAISEAFRSHYKLADHKHYVKNWMKRAIFCDKNYLKNFKKNISKNVSDLSLNNHTNVLINQRAFSNNPKYPIRYQLFIHLLIMNVYKLNVCSLFFIRYMYRNA